jgi:probable phosphoglycerate mutase
MNTKILLIRHGETAWNAERRLQGHADIALNDEGQRQADALGLALAGEPLTAIVASDLLRARQTALALAGHHDLPVLTDSQLRERCYGGFEGLLYQDIEPRYPAEYARWKARDIDALMPPGVRTAESFRQFYARSVAGIVGWAERHPGQTIAIVAHGGVLECACRAARNSALDSPRDFEIKNASINRLLYANGKLGVSHWGDVRHLGEAVMDELL